LKGNGLRPTLVAVIIILAVIGGLAYGFVAGETKLPPYATFHRMIEWSKDQPSLRKIYYTLLGRKEAPRLSGSWQEIGADGGYGRSDPDLRKPGEQFPAVGYLSGYEPPPILKGVTVYRRDEASNGLNLITSGHGQEALLLDMEGRILHRWAYDFADAYPDYVEPRGRPGINVISRDFWRRCYLYPNGDLLAIYDGFGMIKLDRDSHLIWAVRYGCHHDMCVAPDGLIYVITREPRIIPEIDPDRKLLDDFIAVLDPGGHLIRKVSIAEALWRSSYSSLLESVPATPDIFHTNTVQVLDGSQVGRFQAFGQGNVLVSIRNINVVGVIDMNTEEMVWAVSGQWLAQHESTLLPDGNILLLDNKGNNGMSKVIEFAPCTLRIEWAYEGTPENGFYTESSGAAHRLANGNTLIVESNSGRAFETSRDGRVVWEYYSPYRAGKDDRLIATLFDVVRLDQAYVLDWLGAAVVVGTPAGEGE
jgi:hypothetical protein